LFCALQHKKRPSLTTNYRTVIRKITLKITLHRNIIDQNKPVLQKSLQNPPKDYFYPRSFVLF